MVSLTKRSETAEQSSPDDGEGYVSELESLYQLYGQRVYTLCLRLLADRREAELATIDAFVRCKRDWSTAGGEISKRSHLLGAAIVSSSSSARR